MDGSYYPFSSDTNYSYDQSLDFITEDVATTNQRHSMSSIGTLGSGDLNRVQDIALRKPPRPQRQKSLTSEQTKHRRTRSGCYTCRQRRVKCDESRPICERCRKGKRDCTYPDKTTSAKANKAVSKSKSPDASTSNSSSDEQDHDSQAPLRTPDELEAVSATSSQPTRADSKRSMSARHDDISRTGSGSRTPTDYGSSRRTSGFALENTPDWATYSENVKFFLEYFRDNITFCHYAFKHDCRDFLKTAYLEAAVNFKPLLYSLIAFAAYHHALRYPDSKPESFHDYYDLSVSLFRQALVKGGQPPIPVLLTMLQLATIEEFLGDWVNLLGHQRAAAQLMQETYTPNSMTQTFTHRVILVWYWRFDLFAGVLSGNTLTLGREWFASCVDSCATAVTRNTAEDLGVTFDAFFTNSRLLVTDVTLLFAAQVAGELDAETFQENAIQLWKRLEDHARNVENAFRGVPYFNNTWTRDVGPDCLTEFQDPHFMFMGPYFTMNYILIDSWAGRIMFLYRILQLREQGLVNGNLPNVHKDMILQLALQKCKMLEAIQYSDQSPPNAVLGCQASLWIVSLFLPREPRYIDWTRRKLALIETNGYIYPPAYRKYMSEIWNVDVNYWWLPDGEDLTPLIRSMRQFIDFRAKSTPDDREISVRDMNGVFGKMRLQQ